MSVVLVALVVEARAQVAEWKSFTSVGTIKELAAGNDAIWGGSNGGALELNFQNRAIRKFTNTDGLASNDIVAVAIDDDGTVWFALSDGKLNRYFPAQDRWDIIQDYLNQSVTDLVIFGDSLYVGLDIGVSLYSIVREEVRETYQNLGLSNNDDVRKVAANSVFIDGTDLWVSTDQGIALSSLTLPNLQAPSSWQQFTRTQGLPSNEIHNIVVLAGTAYAATNAGVAVRGGDTWQTAGLTGDIVLVELVTSNEFFQRNTVVAVRNDGVFALSPAGGWDRLGPQMNDVTALEADESGTLWIGRRNQGVASFNTSSAEWDLVTANGPGSNSFASLVLDPKGRLWCASSQVGTTPGGVFMFDGEIWTNFSTATGLPSNDYRTIATDAAGRIWAGSWGGGVTIIAETSGGFSTTRIDTTDGILAGFVGDPGFVLVNGLIRDQFDNMWLLNREAVNTRVLVAYTPEDDWVHFSTSPGGLSSRFVRDLAVDRAGRIWVATQDRGISVLDYNDTILDFSDDNFSQGLTTNDGLFTNQITAIEADDDGVMWIGTNNGLNLWFNEATMNEFNIISNAITAIGVDGRNNKWIGTINGITVLRGHLDKIADFATTNSPLVSGNVRSFAFNESTGEVWIGTDNGLSRAQTFFTAPREDLSQLSGFPNPFVIDGRTTFTITNLAENTNVSIFNSAGFLIKKFESSSDIQGAQAFWDGTDQEGNFVASGVYVYLAYTNNDISATGKVAVIRR